MQNVIHEVTHEEHAFDALQAAVTAINDILMELQEAEENILDGR